MGGKGSGKNMPRNLFHNLPEKLLNASPVPTVFIGLILGTKEVKGRRTLTCLGNSYKGTENSRAFETHWGVAPARVLNCTHCCWPVHRGFEEIRNERL